MPKLTEICTRLEAFAPLRLSEEWDNTGLLVGSRAAEINSIMTCLTVTPTSVAEAIREKAELIVTHHPIPFRPLKKITSDTTTGQMLLDLMAARICVYSPHTSFDSAKAGINQRLAEALRLGNIAPLTPIEGDPDGLGSGRMGKFEQPISFGECAERLKSFLSIPSVRIVGDQEKNIRKVAIGCGSAGQFLSTAIREGCDLMVTGEAQFHTCLEAEACNTGLMLLGHFASERFAVEALANILAGEFPGARCWPCNDEKDPLTVL